MPLYCKYSRKWQDLLASNLVEMLVAFLILIQQLCSDNFYIFAAVILPVIAAQVSDLSARHYRFLIDAFENKIMSRIGRSSILFDLYLNFHFCFPRIKFSVLQS